MDPAREIQTILTLTMLAIIDLLVHQRSLKKKKNQQQNPSNQTPPKLWN